MSHIEDEDIFDCDGDCSYCIDCDVCHENDNAYDDWEEEEE